VIIDRPHYEDILPRVCVNAWILRGKTLCRETAKGLRNWQYLDAEINFVLDHIGPSDTVLELGCGYGRVLELMAQKAACAAGIDSSFDSLSLAQRLTRQTPAPWLGMMDAGHLGFRDNSFDVIVCIQNGISAFKVDQRLLIEEAMRVTRRRGTVLFSSYSENFWDDRLEWFEFQAQHGLLGEIDYEATGNGVIVCKDGFKATTVTPDQFRSLTSDLGITPVIEEIDGSSVFCVILVR
jgi:2-polyprenyl-6-hydroxyphenyl methylase/3-demethylubiquinone-9 3-methyltransferase